MKGDEKILDHCERRTSRSSSFVVAHLIWAKKMPFKEALKFVHEKRPLIYPKPGLQNQLGIFIKK